MDCFEVKTDIVADDIHRCSGRHTAPEVMHKRIKAVAGVGGVTALGRQTYMLGMEIAEGEDITLAEHDALRRAGRTGSIEEDERIASFVLSSIGTHEVESLSGVAAIQRHRRHTGFGNRQGHNDHLLVTRHGVTDDMLAATLGVLRIDGVRQFIHLGIGQAGITGNDADGIRLVDDMLFESRYERALYGLGIFGVECIEPCDLFGRAVGDLAHVLGRHHRTEDHAVGRSQLLQERFRIVGGVVTEFEGVLSVGLKEFGAQFPSRCGFTQVGIGHQRLAEVQTAFVGQYGTLIHEHDLIIEPEVAYGVRIGVVLVFLRKVELLVHAPEHIGDRRVGLGLHEHRQGMYHHRDRT